MNGHNTMKNKLKTAKLIKTTDTVVKYGNVTVACASITAAVTLREKFAQGASRLAWKS
jgi:hypothetical protein